MASDEWRVASEEKTGNDETGGASPAPTNPGEMEAREELLEETAANNEGMPESEDSAKTAAAGE